MAPETFAKLKQEHGYTSLQGYDYNKYVALSLKEQVNDNVLQRIQDLTEPNNAEKVFDILKNYEINYHHVIKR